MKVALLGRGAQGEHQSEVPSVAHLHTEAADSAWYCLYCSLDCLCTRACELVFCTNLSPKGCVLAFGCGQAFGEADRLLKQFALLNLGRIHVTLPWSLSWKNRALHFHVSFLCSSFMCCVLDTEAVSHAVPYFTGSFLCFCVCQASWFLHLLNHKR